MSTADGLRPRCTAARVRLSALFTAPNMTSPRIPNAACAPKQRLAPLEGWLGPALGTRARLPRHQKPPLGSTSIVASAAHRKQLGCSLGTVAERPSEQL